MNSPEALSLIEFSSIAAGTRAVDALVKKAPISLERVGTLQPGKMAVLFSGDVASVEASHDEALRVAGAAVTDKVLLPFVEPSVYHAVHGRVESWSGDTLGVLETSGMAAAIHAADIVVKGALVAVMEIRLGDELGGKGLVHIAGEQHDVEAAIDLSQRASSKVRTIVTSITPRIDDELRRHLRGGTRFWSPAESSSARDSKVGNG